MLDHSVGSGQHTFEDRGPIAMRRRRERWMR